MDNAQAPERNHVCSKCGNEFSPNGFANHERKCFTHCLECGRRMARERAEVVPLGYVKARAAGVCLECNPYDPRDEQLTQKWFAIEYNHLIRRMEMSKEWFCEHMDMRLDAFDKAYAVFRRQESEQEAA